MPDRSIIFIDSNTIWHRRLAEALGEVRRTVAFQPRGGLLPSGASWTAKSEGTSFIAPTLLRGWASRTAAIGQRQLVAIVTKVMRELSGEPVVFLTSPVYTPVARLLFGRLPLVYYCADDYRRYEGWGEQRMKNAEYELAARAAVSIFVSEALRERAIKEYGLAWEKTFVSPNATEPRFVGEALDGSKPGTSKFARPILGVLGNVSDRLDLSLLRSAADLDILGTLLIAGAVHDSTARRNRWIANHPKIHVTGALPHSSMHLYSRIFDAALIPYAATPLNFYCSPMRLYDHLASGRPIFASDTCDQLCKITSPQLTVASPSDLLEKICEGLERISKTIFLPPKATSLFWSDRAETLDSTLSRIEKAA